MPSRILFPIAGESSYSNDWGGTRSREATGGTGRHQGNDIFAARGTPVVAVEDGVITKMGPSKIGGNRIWLNGRWYYAHLDRFAEGLSAGSQVRAGQTIGYVGNTGDAATTPPHLHFGYSPDGSQGGSYANPYGILQAAEKAPRPQETPPAPTPQTPQSPQSPQAPPSPLDVPPGAALPVGPPSPQIPGAALPGSAYIPAPPPPNPAETWRLIANQPFSSPEAQYFARLHEGGSLVESV